MAKFSVCSTTGKILSTFNAYVADAPASRKLYNPRNKRDTGVVDATRLNPM